MTDDRARVRILSLDGGAIRGLLAAGVLSELERMLRERDGDEVRIADYFDLVAGTSIGGMISCLLLLPDRNVRLDGAGAAPARPKMTADEVLDFLLEFGPRFTELSVGQRIRRLGGLVDERYSLAGFRAAFDAVLGPPGSEPTLAELLRPTAIPTYRAAVGEPYFFKQHEAAVGGRDFSLRDVALATSAAPAYFEPPVVRSDRDDLGPCVDGGLFANNPAMCAYAEGSSAFGVSAEQMALLSIGTGAVRPRYEARAMRNWGIAGWAAPTFQMMWSGSSVTVDHQLREIFDSLGADEGRRRYLRLQADLSREAKSVARMDNTRTSNMRRLVDLGRSLAHRHRDELERFVESQLVDRPRAGVLAVEPDEPARSSVTVPGVETPRGRRAPARRDRMKIDALVWVRHRNQETVEEASVASFRRRQLPTSGMPGLVRAAAKYPDVGWAPAELVVPDEIPPEGRLDPGYRIAYYGLAKAAFKTYRRAPLDADIPWHPDFPWNREFPPTGDGWEQPTSDETFTRLRLQGPDPWLLRRVDDGSGPARFELDFSRVFAGVLPAIRAHFAIDGDRLAPTEIVVGDVAHRPDDETWDRAKRVVNAADARYVAFGKHLLEVHLVVGQAFALAAYRLPTWHRLRPFMQFFTYSTLAVNDVAYQALLSPGSYFVESGFVSPRDVSQLFRNLVADFDVDRWLAPADVASRRIDTVAGHPYVDDMRLIWPEFAGVVERHLDDLGLDDEAVADDVELQSWYLTLASLLPNTDARRRLDRRRLGELCTILLWNNVVHEVAGDLSPILGSEDPADKSILHLGKLRDAIGDGRLTADLPEPTMAEVFLMDQASFVSRFNVGGNRILGVNAARLVDDPRLREAIEDLQAALTELQVELLARNDDREVRFARMLPRHWEASVSF